MIRQFIPGVIIALSLAVLAGCASNPPYAPVSVQPEPIDLTAFAPKVDSFVVILDVSSSMGEDYKDRQKLHTAQDLVASFNSSVPAAGLQGGLVTFGSGSGKCRSQGTAEAIYGLAPFQSSDFAAALGSIDCAGGTTPMSKGIDATTQLLSTQSGPVAVILVSDFQWVGSERVMQSVAKLKAQHGENLCLHTVKVGDNTTGDAMIASMVNAPGCDSAVMAGDLASAGAMANYVTEVLLAPLEYEKHSVSATTLFDFDKDVLKQQGKAELHNLDEYIKSKGIRVVDIDVVGHTDSMGSAEYNQELSVRRAMAVKAFMVSEGIDAGIIDVIGKGESEPAASNDTDEGRAMNRRVEIHVGASKPRN